MALIDLDTAEELFAAVDTVREALPLVESLTELAFPALLPEIELIRTGQTKLFELLSRLQAAHAVELDAVKTKLRDETVAAWRASRG